MLKAFTSSKLISVFLLNCVIKNITLVTSQDDRGLSSNLTPQFRVPFFRSLERIFISHVVNEQSSRSTLIVVPGKCMIFLLSCCIPNDHLDSLFTDLNLLLEVGGIHCRRLLLVEIAMHKLGR